MASVARGNTSCTAHKKLVKLQAELSLQEQEVKLSRKRLDLATLEADIMSTRGSVRSVRSYAMRSPDIKEPPKKMNKTRVQIIGSEGGEPQGDPDPNPDGGDDSDLDSTPSTVHKPSPKPDPASPIIGEEEIMPTRQVVLTLSEEVLARHQLFPPPSRRV